MDVMMMSLNTEIPFQKSVKNADEDQRRDFEFFWILNLILNYSRDIGYVITGLV